MTDANAISDFDFQRALLTGQPLLIPDPPAVPAVEIDPEQLPGRARPSPGRKVRKMKPQRRPSRAPALYKTEAMKRYHLAGLIAVLVALLALGLGMWILNGFFSVTFMWRKWTIPAGVGLFLHIFISVCEQHLPRAKKLILDSKMLRDFWPLLRIVIYPLFTAVAFYDILSASAELQQKAAEAGLPYLEWGWRFIYTLAGNGLALIPEPLIVIASIALYRIFKDLWETREARYA